MLRWLSAAVLLVTIPVTVPFVLALGMLNLGAIGWIHWMQWTLLGESDE